MVNVPPLAKRNAEMWHDVNATPYVQINDVTKAYDGATVLNGVSLSIYKGELFSLLGQSGCGKTTLLRILAGFEVPTDGSVVIDGADITKWPAHKRPISMMFQSYAIFPHMTVSQNIAFGLIQDKLPKSVIKERIAEVLELVQLCGCENRMPNQLSGGQKQRVALARSLAKRPKLMLLDEPLAALDKKLRERTQFEIVNIQEQVGITFVLVTHDQEEAMTMSTRMAILNDGKVCQVGAPHDVYEFPNSRFVAEFIGGVNLLNGIVIEREIDHVVVQTQDLDCLCHVSYTGAIPIGTTVTLAIRPEKIMISTLQPAYPKNWTRGIVKEIAYFGSTSTYYVQLPSGKTVISMLPNLLRLEGRNFEWGDDVYMFWRSENSVILTS
jgi:putrescine transport system ATP-binding protein